MLALTVTTVVYMKVGAESEMAQAGSVAAVWVTITVAKVVELVLILRVVVGVMVLRLIVMEVMEVIIPVDTEGCGNKGV